MPKRTHQHRTKLLGSCQCRKVRFSVQSETPVPFMFCFCAICRKTGGAAFGCNIMGIRETLRLSGKRLLRSYHGRIREPGRRTVVSGAERCFCSLCGSHLYLIDERWPAGIWPYVSAIDTPLPKPRRPISIMTRFKPSWVPGWLTAHGPTHPGFPKLSIADWHERAGFTVDVKP